jgi:tRNA(Arg) A34 adenosine deaminase TadA
MPIPCLLKHKTYSIYSHPKNRTKRPTGSCWYWQKFEIGREIGKIMNDQAFMREAIRLSAEAVRHGNEPFGAVLVKDDKIVCANENQIYTRHDATFHAELGLIRRYSEETGITDLSEYTLYSSCEPCFMCSGAIVWSKLGRLVYGASDMDLCHIINAQGSACSKIVFDNSYIKPKVTAGVLREESLAILKAYFEKAEKD